MSTMNTKESARSKLRDRDTLSMYNSKHKFQLYRDLNLRKSANVPQHQVAKLFSERYGPEVMASNTIATDREDQESSVFLHRHHVE